MKTKHWIIATVAVGIAFTGCQSKTSKTTDSTVDSAGYVTSHEDSMTHNDRDDTLNNSIDNNKMKDDADFLATAYGDGLFEIEAAKLAQKNASSADVKTLAQKIESDHIKANEQIMALASKNNISLPSSVPEKKQSTYNDLAALTGLEFDKKYIKEMVSCHKDAIDAFEKKTKDANNTDIQNFAVATIPVLTAHKTKADVIKERTDKM
ncbi:DUF4142 domain-containing protein [Solitalea sp. MAHUQ-68]|uniref:DUF4142 domain-containing protein n=1 Tax=Solitalea agri TaxID=2953739 RepID=A0A9X2F5R5_9SPHI|nr:DUF4142 domain-containing protein [Solitalea agri]MCO4294650.1 DUF4142 domain-containing protein [Solitalea agri]